MITLEVFTVSGERSCRSAELGLVNTFHGRYLSISHHTPDILKRQRFSSVPKYSDFKVFMIRLQLYINNSYIRTMFGFTFVFCQGFSHVFNMTAHIPFSNTIKVDGINKFKKTTLKTVILFEKVPGHQSCKLL